MKIVIIGNGISGVTAARYLRKKSSDAQILIVSGETDYFFSRTALMYIYMGHMKYEHTKPYEDGFWAKNRINLKRAWVREIDFENKAIHTETHEEITFDKLILATGSISNKFGWKGQDLLGVQGLYSYQDLQALESRTSKIQTAVIVGGGLIGIELAEMLHARGKHVILLVRESSFWNNVLPPEESELINQHILSAGIELRLTAELNEILGTSEVEGIITKSGEQIECQFVGLTVGVSPNVDFLKNTALQIERGILVNEYLETSIPNVYAIGDCVQHQNPPDGRRNLEQIWYTGRNMGKTVAATSLNEKTKYNPGVFYNSAKFIDIEYQTYGDVPANTPDGIKSFVWQHELKNILVRINYRAETEKVTGVNTFGIRMRQEIWQNWLEKGATISEVLVNLQSANFDPEFFKKYENEIIQQFNLENNANLQLKKSGFFASLFN